MFEINETAEWPNVIHGWEADDFVEGGPDGIDNVPLKELANRTTFLKQKMGEEVDELQEQIDGMKGRGGYLTAHDFGKANPAQQELTDYALEQIGQTDQTKIWNGTHIKNLKNGHVWVLNNTPDTEPPVFEWVDDGVDSVSVGNNDGVAGIVSGGLEFDSVYIDTQGKMRVPGLHTFQADQVEGEGRDLMKVILGHGIEEMTTQTLRNEAIAEVVANLRYRNNINGEIDGSGNPNYRGLMIADFLDGLDLSGAAAPTGGSAPQAWNAGYKNNRLLIGGFNTYKGVGDTEVTKNHIVMVTRNIIAKGRMNATNITTGGYQGTELRPWLDGANGDGTGTFATKLKAALGGNNPLLKIRLLYNTGGDASWDWNDATVFLLSPFGVFGAPGFGHKDYGDGLSNHLPIYQKGSQYRIKRWNGARDWWWLAIPSASSAANFCNCGSSGYSYNTHASSVGGVAPAFCVA
jgi:hypothetical protein